MGGRSGRIGLLVGAAVGAGCAPVFHGEATQPNPIAEPTETLRISEPIDVYTGDMDLNVPSPPVGGMPASIMHMHKYPLHNQAQFTVVSRDRLRFHVQIEHKWQEWADLNNWHAYLEDDQGHHWEPEGLDHATTRLVVQMWDVETRSAQRTLNGGRIANDQFGTQIGDVTALSDDGWKNRQPLGSLAVFRGKGDFVFYQRDLLTPQCRWLKLVVIHSGESFEFTWNFADDVATGAAAPAANAAP